MRCRVDDFGLDQIACFIVAHGDDDTFIAIGAAVAATGNIYYLRAKQAEDKKAAASTVWNTLNGEIRSNSELCKEMRKQLSSTPQQIPMVPFETGACETVSSGSLIVNLDPGT